MFLRSPILAVALLIGTTSFASAQGVALKDSVVIRNSTTITITYESKFNDGPWLKVVLKPGEHMAHFSNILHPLDPAPRVQMRFMDLLPHDIMHYQNMTTGVVADPMAGPRYDFRVTGGRLYLSR